MSPVAARIKLLFDDRSNWTRWLGFATTPKRLVRSAHPLHCVGEGYSLGRPYGQETPGF